MLKSELMKHLQNIPEDIDVAIVNTYITLDPGCSRIPSIPRVVYRVGYSDYVNSKDEVVERLKKRGYNKDEIDEAIDDVIKGKSNFIKRMIIIETKTE